MYKFLSISDIILDKLIINILSISLILLFASILFTIIYYKAKKLNNLFFDLSFIILAIFFSILLCFAENLITSFVIYEMLTLVTIPIICKKEDFFYAKYLLFLSLFLLLPIVLLLMDIKMNNSEILLQNTYIFISQYKNEIILFFSIFGIAKMGLISTHYWLLNAKSAPYPISAILHAVVMINSGIFMYIKIYKTIYANNNILFLPAIIIFFFSCLYSSFKCIFSKDIKEFLIFSTIKSSSFILLVFSLFNFNSKENSLYIDLIVLHSFTKFGLFIIFAFSGSDKINQLYFAFKDYKTQKLLKNFLAFILIIDSGILSISPMKKIKDAILLHDIFQTKVYANIEPSIFIYCFYILSFLTYYYIFRIVIYLLKKN